MRTPFHLLFVLLFIFMPVVTVDAQENGSFESQPDEAGPTPPRLSFIDGQVSFFRAGAQNWAQAQVNMPLSPGDQLDTGSPGFFEIQIGASAFGRGWADTRIAFENQEPDCLKFKVTAGHFALDLRALEPGQRVEVFTPNATITIDHAGYYRLNVAGERTIFITRRGGSAVVTAADGTSSNLSPDTEAVIEGAGHPLVSSYSAPPLDSWDNWNFARTDWLLEAESARYVPPDVYGTSDLDRHGRWRDVPEYGPVWVPSGLSAGWVPYSTGFWVRDPYYGWTWVDSAPWGWAPYHYGRWVYVDRYWCWAPGPMLRRSVYAPALVVFFGGPHGRMFFGSTGPFVSWVALGWGEPCVPWWGRPGFVRRPWWGGWVGPRIVNNVVISPTTVVNVQHIRVYRNAHLHNAVVGAPAAQFHRGGHSRQRFVRMDANYLQPMHSAPSMRETSVNYATTYKQDLRPHVEGLKHPAAVIYAPPVSNGMPKRHDGKPDPLGPATAGSHIVKRPPFAQSNIERRTEPNHAQQPAPAKKEDNLRFLRYPEPQPSVIHGRQQQSQQPQWPDNLKRFELPSRQNQPCNRATASPSTRLHRVE